MRKFHLASVAALAMTLAACGSSADEPTEGETTTPAASETAAPAPDASASASPSATPSVSASAPASPSAAPSPSASASPAAPAKVAAAAPVAFNQCKVCHAVEPGKDGIGPSLAGVFGAKAGVGSFAFSDAMKASGLKWTEANLDEYLTAPTKKVPGTKMSFAGVSDAAKRKAIIDYMKTL